MTTFLWHSYEMVNYHEAIKLVPVTQQRLGNLGKVNLLDDVNEKMAKYCHNKQ